jgi:tetratricopeptide (TPR) repeat protein
VIPDWRATIAACERLFGVDHPDTRTARAQLGELFLKTDDLLGVILLYRDVESRYAAVLGEDHPDTMTARHLLFSASAKNGSAEWARPMLENNLMRRLRVLGPDHPDTLCSRDALAEAYGYRDPQELPLWELNTSARERILGPDHPDTLATRDRLAKAYGHLGNGTKMIETLEETLRRRERLLGPDHWQTENTWLQLLEVYEYDGPDEAVRLIEQRIAAVKQRHGADTRAEFDYTKRLTDLLETAARGAEAIPLLEANAARARRLFGPVGRETLWAHHGLADAYRDSRHDDWVRLCQQTVADCERELGPDHATTLNERCRLASAYLETGRHEQSIQMYRQAVADCERVLGPDHPTTRVARHSLAWTLGVPKSSP